MTTWLICFDIEDDRARTRIGKALLEYGERVQRSVFEVQVANEAEFAALRRRLADAAGEETDVRFYRLCADCRRASSTLGNGKVMDFPAVVII